jgi:hypothetical protein
MSTYIISLEKGLWGSLLAAITMVIHGTGDLQPGWDFEGNAKRARQEGNVVVGQGQ